VLSKADRDKAADLLMLAEKERKPVVQRGAALNVVSFARRALINAFDQSGEHLLTLRLSDLTICDMGQIARNGMCRPSHSALMLAVRITFPHFSVSAAMSCANSTGELAKAA
jgi:hypothetical protein